MFLAIGVHRETVRLLQWGEKSTPDVPVFQTLRFTTPECLSVKSNCVIRLEGTVTLDGGRRKFLAVVPLSVDPK